MIERDIQVTAGELVISGSGGSSRWRRLPQMEDKNNEKPEMVPPRRKESRRLQPDGDETVASPPSKPLPENEAADPPEKPPAEHDAALLDAKGKVFLSDMREFAWKQGPYGWSFGKNGELGSTWARGGRIRVKGETPAKGLSMHPPDRGYTRICYALGQRAESLHGSAAISEDEPGSRPNPTRFVILGDGKLLWRSDSIRSHGVGQVFTVDVSQVKILELRVYVETGSCWGSHAVWIDPYVIVKE